MIAYALGYDWSAGMETPKKNEPVTLIVRVPEESEVIKRR
jgi:hypothetical protein